MGKGAAVTSGGPASRRSLHQGDPFASAFREDAGGARRSALRERERGRGCAKILRSGELKSGGTNRISVPGKNREGRARSAAVQRRKARAVCARPARECTGQLLLRNCFVEAESRDRTIRRCAAGGSAVRESSGDRSHTWRSSFAVGEFTFCTRRARTSDSQLQGSDGGKSTTQRTALSIGAGLPANEGRSNGGEGISCVRGDEESGNRDTRERAAGIAAVPNYLERP